MKYQLLGNTGVYVSRFCLGTMTFGGRGIPPYDQIGGLNQAEIQDVVNAALDSGINFIDTADVYAQGESEELLGKAISSRRNDLVLATKFHAPVGRGPNQRGQSRLHMMQALENSLRRLQTDHIDLYQIHNFDPLTPFEETLRALDDAVRQGKIRYIGCSNLAAWQAMKALGISERNGLERFVSIQAYYSLAGRDIEYELLPLIEDQKMGLMVWSPLAAGFLSGKYDRHTEQGLSRRDKFEFPPINRERVFDIIDVLRLVAQRHSATPAQIALAWLLARPAVTSVITGVRRVDQLHDNMAALELRLSPEDIAELDAISEPGLHYPNWIQANWANNRIP